MEAIDRLICFSQGKETCRVDAPVESELPGANERDDWVLVVSTFQTHAPDDCYFVDGDDGWGVSDTLPNGAKRVVLAAKSPKEAAGFLAYLMRDRVYGKQVLLSDFLRSDDPVIVDRRRLWLRATAEPTGTKGNEPTRRSAA